MSGALTLDFVQRLCFIHNVKRAFILEKKNHTDILISKQNYLDLFRKKSSSFSL